MRQIGRTNEGSYLVEMSHDEVRAFALLAMAVEGTPWDTVAIRDNASMYSTEYDIADTFDCIRAFASTLFRVNDLEALVGDLRASVLRRDNE